ncbi:hypothetical protein [Winogradskyella sp. SYSU M77433]|uniref:hypothetical protein n=1 Tax=Winogradskyella sp. SYSU M77433 TaxID=3042722 RepID=UPI002480D89C|nr:hypothetical protein [Winogradskyella sp. SYSU M77433]MDH7911354.1 hypothetical protein [Winogradskyella sp. SYSU M77433]
MKNLTPLVHNSLKHEMDIKSINDSDTECLKEIKEVLKKYNSLDRFGITLLHKHFELDKDEILIEAVDEENRIQIIKPFKIEEVEKMEGEVIETSWALIDEKEAILACRRKCVKTGEGHYNSHVFGS